MTWQIFATFRLGGWKTKEIDLTPALGLSLITVAFFLLLKAEGL